MLKSQSDKKYIIRAVKCKCGKAWCPKCSLKTTIQTFTSYLENWDWRFVRQITLTIDPKTFNTEEEALKEITKGKKIPALIRNLERTKGINVIDWCWILEWHRNGFPHWHLFILVDQDGKDGQIGFRTVLPYWEYGRISEDYIKSERHWNSFTGYFRKHGYFDKRKAHQSRLPEWARNQKNIIRRIGRKSRRNPDRVAQKNIASEPTEDSPNIFDQIHSGMKLGDWFLKQSDKHNGKTQGEMIDECGSKTDIYLGLHGFKNWLTRVDEPYDEIRKMKGEYIEGQGYVIEMNRVEFELFRAKHFIVRAPSDIVLS